ncbi:MAG: hypothetical protein RBU24_05720 [Kiritimatiellia bacterium]|jgi:hypothetical protein|nr:hypothetical protein [Kiritimatiellia bacterium]
MMDILNCDGMTAEQARAALRAHCRAQEAARKAERDVENAHRTANCERLGITGGSPTRPAHYPARHGWQKLTHNGDPATGVLSGFEWRCLATEHPYKLLTFVAVVRRHKCYKWQIQLEGQDLTKATAWLEASDIDKITGAKIHFRNGFVLESRDGIAVASPKRMTEAEIQASAVILDVVEAAALQQAEHKPLTSEKPKARATTQQSGFSKQAHDFIEWAWPEFVLMRKGTKLRVSRHRFIIHDKYREECQKHGITNDADVRKIQDALRNHKPVEKK